jgi:hypothetical protein
VKAKWQEGPREEQSRGVAARSSHVGSNSNLERRGC